MKQLNNKATRNKIKQKGFGALEVMIALLLGVIVIVGAAVWYTKLRGASDKGQELENISSLISNVRMLRSTAGYGTNNTSLVPVLINAEGVPGNMSITGTTAITNSYGNVSVVSTGTGFTIGYNAVPAADCIFLITKSSGQRGTSIKVNGGTARTGEITAATASTDCSTAANTIAWTSF